MQLTKEQLLDRVVLQRTILNKLISEKTRMWEEQKKYKDRGRMMIAYNMAVKRQTKRLNEYESLLRKYFQ